MKRKVMVEVKQRKDAQAIERALALPDVRAFCITVGVLDVLPTDRARARVLRFVADFVNDAQARELTPPTDPGERFNFNPDDLQKCGPD